MDRLIALLVVTAALALVSPPAQAGDRCRARIRPRDGTILVFGSGFAANPRWGYSPSECSNTFFNEGTCVSGGSVRKCELGAPGSSARIEPPDLCTLYLCDDGPGTCAAYIKKCTPGCRGVQSQCEAGASGVPSGAVIAFNLSVCPPGWSPYAEAVGRVVVGGGTVGLTHAGANGSLALGDAGPNILTQVPEHQHFTRINSADDNPHRDSVPTDGTAFSAHGQDNRCQFFSEATALPALTGYEDPPSGQAVTSCFAGKVGGVNVAMPYVQLLYCQKD